jgi:hypothetical protein
MFIEDPRKVPFRVITKICSTSGKFRNLTRDPGITICMNFDKEICSGNEAMAVSRRYFKFGDLVLVPEVLAWI